MITEDYVSFETAKLLKEKGFNENCATLYDLRSGELQERQAGYVFNNSQWDNFVTAPTLQMAMKWLRKKYDLHIIVYPWEVVGEGKDSKHWCCQVYKSFNQLSCSKYTNETVKSYEDACEAAIKYCLENLI